MKIAFAALCLLLIAGSAPAAMAASPRVQTAAKAQAAPRLKRLDANGDQRISAAEWAGRKGKPRPKAFERLDRNQDGYVDASELQVRAIKAQRAAPARADRAERRAERLAKRAGQG